MARATISTQQNLFSYSDPLNTGQLGTVSNVTAPGAFAWTGGPGLVNAVVFGDNSLSRLAYLTYAATTGMQMTFSFYVQMDDLTTPRVSSALSGASNIDFHIVTETGFSIISSITVQSVGGNVYRIYGTIAAVGAGHNSWGVSKLVADSAKTFKVSGFQLVQANQPAIYVPTTGTPVTTPVRNIVSNRKVGSGRASIPTLQNLLLQSQTFTVSPWSNDAVVTANADTAPDGTMTAATVQDNSAGSFLQAAQSITIALDVGTYTISLYIKKTVGATVECGFNLALSGGTGVSNSVRINTNAGSIDTGTATAVVSGNYWRISMPITNNRTNNALFVRFFPATGALPYSGDNAASVGTQTIWGAQVTKANFAGVYAPTTSSAVNTGSLRNIVT